MATHKHGTLPVVPLAERMLLRELEALHYSDPEPQLRRLAAVEDALIRDPHIDPETLAFRTRAMKPHGERRQAALFTYAMSQAIGCPIHYAMFERDDFDCVLRWIDDDTLKFTTVQLKELVPESRNPQQTLQALLDGLGTRYPTSHDLVVAIYMNRSMHLDFSQPSAPDAPVGEIWLYGGTMPMNEGQWMLWGSLTSPNPRAFFFRYPGR